MNFTGNTAQEGNADKTMFPIIEEPVQAFQMEM